MRLRGGDVDVQSVTGFRQGEPMALVRITVLDEAGGKSELFMTPADARRIGLDCIGAAHSSVADMLVRQLAKDHGFDGDHALAEFRRLTMEELP